jgi:hypothetical protein
MLSDSDMEPVSLAGEDVDDSLEHAASTLTDATTARMSNSFLGIDLLLLWAPLMGGGRIPSAHRAPADHLTR